MAPRTFQEVRYLRRGPAGRGLIGTGFILLVVAVLVAGEEQWVAPLLFGTAGFVVLGVAAIARVETTVTSTHLSVRVVPGRTHRIPVEDIAEAEVVLADNLVVVFGGWNARAGLAEAIAGGVEGDRSIGNRAVRIRRRDGREFQVGSWRPWTLVETLDARRARP